MQLELYSVFGLNIICDKAENDPPHSSFNRENIYFLKDTRFIASDLNSVLIKYFVFLSYDKNLPLRRFSPSIEDLLNPLLAIGWKGKRCWSVPGLFHY